MKYRPVLEDYFFIFTFIGGLPGSKEGLSIVQN
jgi:hypothetical protein